MEELNADNDIEDDEEEDDSRDEDDVAGNIDEGVAGSAKLDDGRDVSGACSSLL